MKIETETITTVITEKRKFISLSEQTIRDIIRKEIYNSNNIDIGEIKFELDIPSKGPGAYVCAKAYIEEDN